jgi:hypothetical protein
MRCAGWRIPAAKVTRCKPFRGRAAGSSRRGTPPKRLDYGLMKPVVRRSDRTQMGQDRPGICRRADCVPALLWMLEQLGLETPRGSSPEGKVGTGLIQVSSRRSLYRVHAGWQRQNEGRIRKTPQVLPKGWNNPRGRILRSGASGTGGGPDASVQSSARAAESQFPQIERPIHALHLVDITFYKLSHRRQFAKRRTATGGRLQVTCSSN